MNILVSGATSFIGSRLLPLLRKRPDHLTCLVRAPKGQPGEVVWDFRSTLPDGIPAPDIIVHMAAKPYFGTQLDAEQYTVNVLASGALARLAHKTGALMVFTSAAIIHGDAPRIDRQTPLRPQSHYALTKMLAEGVISQWTDRHVFLRIGGIYGLDGPAHLGLNRSISAAYHQQTIPTLAGPGTAFRNYICVEDVARWILWLIDECSQGRPHHGHPLYLAGPETMPIKEYLTQVARKLTAGEGPIIQEGGEGRDFVLEADPAPFRLTSFDDYLTSLQQKGRSDA